MEARRYKLSILPLFEEDLNEIVDYIALRLENLLPHGRSLTMLRRRSSSAHTAQNRFEPYHSLRERDLPYYRIYVRNYVIFYVVKDDVMEVRRILYSRRDLKNLI